MATRKEKIVWLDVLGKEHDTEVSAEYEDAMLALRKRLDEGPYVAYGEIDAENFCNVVSDYKKEVRAYLDAGERLLAASLK